MVVRMIVDRVRMSAVAMIVRMAVRSAPVAMVVDMCS